jgi:hypothetical protein
MSGCDIFAWIVLIILLASAIGVRAPADGYVTNLALRKGARVANLPLSPVMAFIDTPPPLSSGSRSIRTMLASSSLASKSRSLSSSRRERSIPAKSRACFRRLRLGSPRPQARRWLPGRSKRCRSR